MLTAVAGINWGDEGKGRMVDLLSAGQDIVVRYQGGNNAGHTVVNERGKFVLNLLPSGILRPGTVNVMGGGMVIDLAHLRGEIGRLRVAGVEITPDNLKISDRAAVCTPCDVRQDCLEEGRLKDRKFGSTLRGIAPAYGDKYMKKSIRVGDLLNPGYMRKRASELLDWKNLTLREVYGDPGFTLEELCGWLEENGAELLPFICDTGAYLSEAAEAGKNILFEAQLGALRDIDFGIYPFTSSSSTVAGYAPVGAGIPGCRLDRVIGIMKAYSTCVGEGPFTCELRGAEADRLREAGGEYGAATGRPRRVGPFDLPASRYGCEVQGAGEIALTKLDVLSYLDRIPVCTAYDIAGRRTLRFPSGQELELARPVTEYLPGWGRDISACRSFGELPTEAQDYVRFIEKSVGRKISFVSVGAERDEIIVM